MTNDNGINDQVTEQELLSQVKFMLKIKDTNEHDTSLLQYINDGVRKLRNNFALVPLVAQLQIDLTTFTAKLPKGFYKLNGQYPIRTFSQNVAAPLPVMDGFYVGKFNDYASAQVVGEYIRFGSDIKDNYCQISYLGTNLTPSGELAIPRIADMCVRYYAMFNHYLSEQNPLWQFYKGEYDKEKRFVRGEFANLDNQDGRKVSEGYNKFNANTNFPNV